MRACIHRVLSGLGGAVVGTLVLASPLVSLDAEAQESKRVGIVFSQPSSLWFYDEFVYSQLFAAMQHQAIMAGVPFDILSEDDLTSVSNLQRYDALVFPQMGFVTRSKQAAILDALSQASANYGVGLIAAGDFMVYDETGAALPGDPYAAMRLLLGVEPVGGVWGPPTTLIAADTSHPAMASYSAGEEMMSYSALWFGTFTGTTSGSSTLVTAVANGQSYPGVIATQTGGRNVLFANDQMMGDTDVVWPCIQWVVYGSQAPVALKMGRNVSIFSARTDMDQSMYPEELATVEVPLYDMIARFKADYDFVGSFFINIGNRPNQGEYTDWSVSGPLYKKYMALGNEIGTHSWTHPDNTIDLTATQLDFEFRQSAAQIGQQLGIQVLGTAIPGNPEDLRVDQTIAPYFQYISGRSGQVGWGAPGANGWLRPDLKAVYLSMSMSPDWTLVGWLKYTPAQAVQIWHDEYLTRLRHGSQPLVHFLWHDYAAAGFEGFVSSMYTDIFSWLYGQGTEFVTVADAQQRIRTFAAADLLVSDANPLLVRVEASDVGRFSLKMGPGRTISSVDGWYAYDEDQVFLAQGGGEFVVHYNVTPADVTHVTSLPMRAKLQSVAGNGRDLTFQLEGEGIVKAYVPSAIRTGIQVAGADSVTMVGGSLEMRLGTMGVHTVTITAPASTCTDADHDGFYREGGTCGVADCDDTNPNVNPSVPEVCNDGIDNNCNGAVDAADPACAVVDQPPVAVGGSVQTLEDTSVPVPLEATDPDGDALSWTILQAPAHGTLTGTAPYLVYEPAANYNGTDSFTFYASDGLLSSNIATMSITVTAVNDAPVFSVSPVVASDATANTPYTGTVAGSAVDPDGTTPTYSIVSGPTWLTMAPAGTITGTPSAADVGVNSWQIQASDGIAPPVPGTLTVTVRAALALPPVDASFVSIAAEDGWLRESTETSGVGGAATSTGTGSQGLRVGDNALDQQIKSIVSFDTSPIPDTAVVLSATLRLTRGAITGTNPLQTHGTCLLEIKKGGFGTGTALAASDLQAAADAVAGTIAGALAFNTTYDFQLSKDALAYVNLTGRTQLRMAFTLDDDDDQVADLLGFYAADTAKAARRPVLMVRYQP